MNLPPKQPKPNGKGKHITQKEIDKHIKEIRKGYIQKVLEIIKKKNPPK